MIRHYILKNREVVQADDLIEWALFYSHGDESRIVAKTDLPTGFHISTVFIGTGHILFETCVFSPDTHISVIDGKPLHESNVMRRYDTWDQAQAGHDELVAQYSIAVTAPDLERKTPHERG